MPIKQFFASFNWKAKEERKMFANKGECKGKQTLIGAQPPMFTGLPAKPASLARWPAS